MLPRMIYLNGPPGSGKTALADALCAAVPHVIQIQFPMPLWEIADGVLHMSGILSDIDEPLNFATQEVKSALIRKDRPHTWRDFLVEQANVLRKYFGPNILSHIAARAFHDFAIQGIDTAIFPNVRTFEDLTALIPLAPKRDQVLIRLEREGCTFEGDNGSYITPSGIMSVTLSNNGTIPELLIAVLNFLEEDPNEPA